jgi:hypothetical protein
VAESVLKTNHGDIPVVVSYDMPVGCMVMVSSDGRQVIPIINLDIEICSELPPGPPKIEYGSFDVSGEMTAYFESEELYAHFTSGMKSIGRHITEAAVKLGDQFARSGQLNRSGRKQWRKDRKRLVASMRRADARERRTACGERVF